MSNVCGYVVMDIDLIDDKGCILEYGHTGPHEFISTDGEHWLWETDMECTCEHCMQCEGDYCFDYWKKTA